MGGRGGLWLLFVLNHPGFGFSGFGGPHLYITWLHFYSLLNFTRKCVFVACVMHHVVFTCIHIELIFLFWPHSGYRLFLYIATILYTSCMCIVHSCMSHSLYWKYFLWWMNLQLRGWFMSVPPYESQWPFYNELLCMALLQPHTLLWELGSLFLFVVSRSVGVDWVWLGKGAWGKPKWNIDYSTSVYFYN